MKGGNTPPTLQLFGFCAPRIFIYFSYTCRKCRLKYGWKICIDIKCRKMFRRLIYTVFLYFLFSNRYNVFYANIFYVIYVNLRIDSINRNWKIIRFFCEFTNLNLWKSIFYSLTIINKVFIKVLKQNNRKL